jgi:hypothetical protein
MNEAILKHLARTEAMLEVLIETYSAVLAHTENKDKETIQAMFYSLVDAKSTTILEKLLQK